MPDALERYYGVRGGANDALLFIKEAASQSFKAGDLVLLSSGKVAVAGTDNADLDTDDGAILGMALKDASGVTDTLVPVIPATDNTHFLLGAYNATKATAVPSQVAVGETTTLYRKSGIVGVNVPAASAKQNALIADKLPGMEGVTYGPIWVKILAAYRALG